VVFFLKINSILAKRDAGMCCCHTLAGVYGKEGPHGQRPWCSQTIPSAYGYVQRVYWLVGFLKYYQWSQVRCAGWSEVVPSVGVLGCEVMEVSVEPGGWSHLSGVGGHTY
jgi:hypothetical protein